MAYEGDSRRLENAEATVVALLRNVSVLHKVVDVLLDHWGEDKDKARRGIQFICNHEVKKQGSDAELQAVWRKWAQLHITEGAEPIEGPLLEGKNTWG